MKSALAASVALPYRAARAGGLPEILYNGIRLANPWPPRNRYLSDDPVRPPYLDDPPAVIPIDVGRQLFVDDFLIQETTLARRFHQAAYDANNPVLRPSTDWERYDAVATRTNARPNPAAMVFSDGVFYDPDDRLFKMWYMGGYNGKTCYVFSEDGIHWIRPMLDVVPHTNIVLKADRDSNTVWLDPFERDRSQRYKLAWYDGSEKAMMLNTSPDGIHWTFRGSSGRTGDRSTFFYNPFRRRWVFSLREDRLNHRSRRYWEGEDFLQAAQWLGEPPLWTGTDSLDPPRSDYGITPQLYNLDCVGYESVMLGLFTIWRGERGDREKPNEVCVGFSRDGFHWERGNRAALVPVSEHVGDWNWANVQSAGGCCLIVGDELYFYVSGRRGVPGTSAPGICSTGLAKLRRDGFASMELPDASTLIRRVGRSLPPGTLVTRPVRFSGRHLFVNADLGRGVLRAQVEDVNGIPIPHYTLEESVPARGDGTAMLLQWRQTADLSSVAQRPVRLRFSLGGGQLYSFWVSRTASGPSGGYLAAGGPGLKSPFDQ